ncbi:MAG: S9 family peptidase [Acidobacteriota bacterium]
MSQPRPLPPSGPFALAVCTLLLLGACAPPPEPPGADDPLSLERIFRDDAFRSPLPRRVMWRPGGEQFLTWEAGEDGHREIWAETARSGERRRLVDLTAVLDALAEERPGREPSPLGEVNMADPARLAPVLSPDGRSLVGLHRGDLYRLDLETGRASLLTNDPAPEWFPTFSPDGRRLAFVRDGDLYVLPAGGGPERRLTRRTRPTEQNGLADWVHEEELDVPRAFWWSPDGQRLLYARYDVSPVPVFTITDDLPLYPTVERQRYPKAGLDNARVRLGIVPAAGGPTRWLSTPRDEDGYLVRAGFTPDGRPWFVWLTRSQTRLTLRVFDDETGPPRTLVEEFDPRWVELLDEPRFLDDGRLLWVSDRDGYRHLYLFAPDGSLVRQLTAGPFEVRRVLGVHAASGRVLFVSNRGDARGRRVEAVSLDGGEIETLTPEPGTHDPRPSPDLELLLVTSSTANRPPRLDLLDAAGTTLRTVNDGAIPALDGLDLPPIEFEDVPATDGTTLHAAIIRPPGFSPARRYPLLVYVYGGPHAQLVTDRWAGSRGLFLRHLARLGLVVWWLDNRGSAGRGREFERAVYRRLGERELADQLDGIRWLQEQGWVDGDRIAIYGGSYGGFMTLYALLHAPETFRAGVSYAPVVDWRLYDTIYTERYMDTPDANPDGYAASELPALADRLEAELLLMHGLMDNNVHFQNTVRMIDALTRAGKPFELMVYPRARHGIRTTGSTRLDFHRRQRDFLLRTLEPSP